MHNSAPAADRPPWFAIALLSCCALAYEILLTRLFSMVHWSSLVGLIISLALLGYGASGTFLALLRERLLPRFELTFTLNALLFSISSIAAFQLAQRLPLNPVELAWDYRQLLYLGGIYLLLAIPFFAVANCIGLTLGRFRNTINSIYAADLAGAGIGAAGIVGLLFLVTTENALLYIAIGGALAASLSALELRSRQRTAYGIASLATALCIVMTPSQWRQALPAEYKDLSQTLAASGAEVVQQQSNPLGMTTLVDNRVAPLRYAPGLSLASPHSPPIQTAVFSDGDFAGALYSQAKEQDFLGYLGSALPYYLLSGPRVLLIGADDGTATAQAIAMDASRIDLVEHNPFLIRLLKERLSAQPAEERTVALHQGAFRQYLLAQGRRYDLVQLGVAGGLGQTSGLQAQRENYLHTVESVAATLQRLHPDGLLATTRGLRLPPRDSLKFTATAIDALERLGVEDPSGHLAVIRGWNTVTILVSPSPLTAARRQAIRQFSSSRMFDLVYLPDITEDELNRFHRLDTPRLNRGITTLLKGERETFIDDYPFNITPATDDRPYFDRFTRLSGVIDLYRHPGRTGLAHIDWGVGFLLIALLLALVSSLLLILLPLALWHNRPASNRGRTFTYFSAIGLAFLFVEIAFIQKLNLFLGSPFYATAAVLGGFLAFAGLGSYLSRPLCASLGIRKTLLLSLGTIVIMGCVSIWLLPHLLEGLAGMAMPWRIAASLLIQAPLAVAMGMPFPIGMTVVGEQRPEQLPWAWGINGCASVISALLAVLLAMEIGFSGLIMIAVLLYIIAFLGLPPVSSANRCTNP
ncbi:MAG: spermidine synthase [Sedimenticola sp.]